jgi:hypothetical protein
LKKLGGEIAFSSAGSQKRGLAGLKVSRRGKSKKSAGKNFALSTGFISAFGQAASNEQAKCEERGERKAQGEQGDNGLFCRHVAELQKVFPNPFPDLHSPFTLVFLHLSDLTKNQSFMRLFELF